MYREAYQKAKQPGSIEVNPCRASFQITVSSKEYGVKLRQSRNSTSLSAGDDDGPLQRSVSKDYSDGSLSL